MTTIELFNEYENDGYIDLKGFTELIVELICSPDEFVISCPECLGTGNEICSNPDHGFMEAIGTIRLNGHANGCPCCGNDELHRIPNTICNKCNGTGKFLR